MLVHIYQFPSIKLFFFFSTREFVNYNWRQNIFFNRKRIGWRWKKKVKKKITEEEKEEKKN